MTGKGNQADLPHFLTALEEYNRTNANMVKCDTCHAAIRFHKRGTALFHECDCGRFTGTLRGL